MRKILVLLTLALAAPAAAAAAIPVTFTALRGLPSDASDRDAFLTAFHAAMEAELPAESLARGAWSAAGARSNPFRLVDVATPGLSWSVELTVGLPPPVRVERPKPKGAKVAPRPRLSDVRAARGLIVAVTVIPPDGAVQTADPTPQRVELYFADARRVIAPTTKLPGGGYDYPWADAGSVVARVVLEALDRARGAMDPNTRADLTPATRAEAEETP